MRLRSPCGVKGIAADALVDLVQSCYPSATVLFTSVANNVAAADNSELRISSSLDAWQAKLHTRRAWRQGLSVDTPGFQRILARRHIVPARSAEAAASSWWALLYAADATNRPRVALPRQPSQSLPPSHIAHPILCCPDAIVYIGGVEVRDVTQVVAPTLVDAVTRVEAPHSTVGAASATHRAERQAPSYCRRRVDWPTVWADKRCAMRGADLLELSLAVPSDLGHRHADVRERVLVSIANPDVTLADLQRQPHAGRRGPLRTSFGFSLPCVQAALPAAVIRAVRVLRRWQRDVAHCIPSTSAFWVSSIGHLLETSVGDAASPLTQWAEACTRQEQELGMSETQMRHLFAIVQPDSDQTSTRVPLPEDATKLLTFLLTSTVLQLACTSPLEAWNGTNYFLPAERFDGTTDAEVLLRTMRSVAGTHLTFPIFSSLYGSPCGAEQGPLSQSSP
ncbi:conserved hypothetical protein [Leishmania major strain Friedlin]|uniref:Uncharacterized protein n=1 Tax=Leishmania major TaxID=5664 RepID=E9AD48_LEIMA|nr:conserved hypothetical protein [Leishmania major strain Friedlin]CAG9576671.1 hypothetical_protein_-_conserved [Leishmania major strain Friedlin]CBZ12131.1 conserved hypothetical protein [Leishmania major strain Friedlin]|eukprot:XP_003721877.1 conserved hypothetical protein [Leishmania major strain Friedlin]